MNAIEWFMGRDTIKVVLNYRKEINGNIVKIYNDMSDELILIIDREQKTFSLEIDLATKRKRNWHQYFKKNNYKKIKGENQRRYDGSQKID